MAAMVKSDSQLRTNSRPLVFKRNNVRNTLFEDIRFFMSTVRHKIFYQVDKFSVPLQAKGGKDRVTDCVQSIKDTKSILFIKRKFING